MGGEFVLAAGTGQFIKDELVDDFTLRYAPLVTITSETCSSWTVNKNDPDTIICAFENFLTGQAAYKGDSGIQFFLFFLRFEFHSPPHTEKYE